MLWTFYKHDPDICSYLMGTMHLATKEAYTYADIAKIHLKSSSLRRGNESWRIC
ncbi:MAG: hypothetical protein IPO94_06520 [Saprospiraceae bacterium]|nr:hypothetical protein [Saprospiraceae bacterium]